MQEESTDSNVDLGTLKGYDWASSVQKERRAR